MELVRLQKYLANQGVASRRKCEQYMIDRKNYSKWRSSYKTWTKDRPRK